MSNPKTYPALVRRAEAMEAKAKAATEAATKARWDIRQWGRARFLAALSKRGILPKQTLIRIKGDRATSRSAATPDVPALLLFIGDVSPPNACSQTWWIGMSYARQKKRGGYRDEWLHLSAYGKTPEEAAKMVEKWNE
jgi:hypothetical protein